MNTKTQPIEENALRFVAELQAYGATLSKAARFNPLAIAFGANKKLETRANTHIKFINENSELVRAIDIHSVAALIAYFKEYEPKIIQRTKKAGGTITLAVGEALAKARPDLD